MPRVLLLLPTATYRASDFLEAARAVGTDVVVASERAQVASPTVVVDFEDVPASVTAIAEEHARSPLDAVLAVDEQGVVVAAAAAAHLGLRHNPVDAVRATRDKAELRRRLTAAGLRQPGFVSVAIDPPTLDTRFSGRNSPVTTEVGPENEMRVEAGVRQAVGVVGLPCVVKPVGLAMSRGVQRADTVDEAVAAAVRAATIAGCGPVVVETFVAGDEVAVEGLLSDGAMDVLAVFDKPDPLDGPTFAETLYVTPSRHGPALVEEVVTAVAAACRAVGLVDGPVHAEVRLPAEGAVVVLEVAARSIGGLCGRTLRFGLGLSLEEVLLRHALGRRVDVRRENAAAGVLMLPVTRGGRLVAVDGVDDARAVEGIAGVEITVVPGTRIAPLPEGDRYLGFVFARAADAATAEAALRDAWSRLTVRMEPVLPRDPA